MAIRLKKAQAAYPYLQRRIVRPGMSKARSARAMVMVGVGLPRQLPRVSKKGKMTHLKAIVRATGRRAAKTA
jgi:hypothetical protein